MNYDNPPARLHEILSAGLLAERSRPCRHVWAELLGAPLDEGPILFSRLGRLMALPNETADFVAVHFPHLSSSIPLWRDPIDAGFLNQQLGGKWESFVQHINPYCVPQLATLAELMHTKLGTVLAENAAVQALIENLAALVADVEASDLSPDLKLYILRELASLRLNLGEYAITGSATAIRQAEAVVGHMHRDKRFYDFMTSHETGKRVLDNLNAVVGVLTIYVSLAQIAAPTFALLPK